MSNYIQLKDSANNIIWEKNLSNQEFQDVKGYCNGREAVDLFSATLKPVRTHNLKVFASDFFFPTTVNHAIKVKSIVIKVFAILASLMLDFITFPVRLLTCIPRAISNSRQSEHSLLHYLNHQNLNNGTIEADYVKVRLIWETTSTCEYVQFTDSSGRVHRKYHQFQKYEEKYVNFKELPAYPDCDRIYKGNKTI
ncbi:MAG: hypothetical protein Tsb0021_13670 [Chlamydiales bacterium]